MKFEYQVFEQETYQDAKEVTEWLNRMGEMEWELIQIIYADTQMNYYFKRRKY